MRAIQNRLRNLFKHVQNPEAKKLEQSNPRSKTESTQTEKPSEKTTSMHYDHLHDRYRPVSKAIPPRKATGDAKRGLVSNKPRPKLQTMVVVPSNVPANRRWPSTEL